MFSRKKYENDNIGTRGRGNGCTHKKKSSTEYGSKNELRLFWHPPGGNRGDWPQWLQIAWPWWKIRSCGPIFFRRVLTPQKNRTGRGFVLFLLNVQCSMGDFFFVSWRVFESPLLFFGFLFSVFRFDTNFRFPTTTFFRFLPQTHWYFIIWWRSDLFAVFTSSTCSSGFDSDGN